jgi:hypothetical protein
MDILPNSWQENHFDVDTGYRLIARAKDASRRIHGVGGPLLWLGKLDDILPVWDGR